MRMNVKLFTLQMTHIKAEEPCRNSSAEWNRQCGILKFAEKGLIIIQLI
jgi:hypothetical protein